MLRLLTIAVVLLGCTACASKPPLEDNSDFAPIRPLEPAANALPTGSILGNNMHMSLFQGQRQWRVGDIITIVLNESTQASRNSSLITERKATLQIVTAFDLAQTGVKKLVGAISEVVHYVRALLHLRNTSTARHCCRRLWLLQRCNILTQHAQCANHLR